MVADRHTIGGTTVSIANVATRWVLDQPAVGAVIVGELLKVHTFVIIPCAASTSPSPHNGGGFLPFARASCNSAGPHVLKELFQSQSNILRAREPTPGFCILFIRFIPAHLNG